MRGTPLRLMLTPLTASAIRQERTNSLAIVYLFPFLLGKSTGSGKERIPGERGWRESEGLRWGGRADRKRNANMLKFITRLRVITHINPLGR